MASINWEWWVDKVIVPIVGFSILGFVWYLQRQDRPWKWKALIIIGIFVFVIASIYALYFTGGALSIQRKAL